MKSTIAAALIACLVLGCAANKPRQDAAAASSQGASTNLVLSGDTLFAFGKSGIADLSGSGRAQLDAFAAGLVAQPFELVRVVGHSDRIGSDKANMALSKRRAESVRDYLAQRGVPADRIIATGLGAYRPVVACERERGQALVDCLAPNRRVEISVVPKPPR